MDIATWLHDLGLSVYEQAFRENAIELELLPRLTADDLKEIGVIPVGHRRKLLDAIAGLRASALRAPDGAQDVRVQSPSPVDPIGERRQVTVLRIRTLNECSQFRTQTAADSPVEEEEFELSVPVETLGF